MMAKRIIASTVGAIGVFAGLIALAFAIEGIEDFRNPDVQLWFTTAGELIMFAMALAALCIGIRFLRFGWRGRSDLSGSWVRPILLGTAFFFPGFIFSLPLTVVWARHTWPGDGQSVFAAMEASFYIGIAAAIIVCGVLLRKRQQQGSHGIDR